MSKQKLIIIIAAAVLVVAISAGLFIALGNGSSSASPAQQYIQLESAALHALVNSMADTPNGEVSSLSTSTIDIIPSEALFTMFGLGNMDTSWAEKLTLKMDSQVDGMLINSFINVGLNGQSLLIADLVSNSTSGNTYISLPTIANGYLKIPQDNIAGSGAASVSGILSQFNAPEMKTVKALLNKYIDIALANMTLVEKTTQDMTISDKTQTVTVYTNYITEKIFNDTIKAILNEAKNDTALKAILPDGVEIDDAIDQMLSNMNPEPSEDKDEAIVLIAYVNKDNKIIGHTLNIDRQIGISSLTLSDKKGSVSEHSATLNDVKYTLTGTNNTGSGSYALSMTSGDQTLILGTLTYTVNGQSGNCELKLSDFIEQNIFGNSEVDPTLKINWNIQDAGNTADIDLYLYLMSQQVIGIETSFTALEGDPDIFVPNSSLDITDEGHMDYYKSILDLTTLEQNLRTAGVPDALVDLFMTYFFGNIE